MVATQTSFHSYEFSQTTNGTDEYYVGINGVNSFSITPFAGIDTMTFNCLINFPSTVDSTTLVGRLCEISNAARTGLYSANVGDFTGTLTNEFIGMVTLIAGITRATGVTAAGSISAGWHMVTIVVTPGTVRVLINGINFATTNSAAGAPVTISSGYTADRMALFGTTAGGAVLGATWREALFVNSSWSVATALGAYNYYTRKGNVSLANSNRSVWRFLGSTASRATVLALYRGNESGTNLLDMVSASRSLTKTNF